MTLKDLITEIILKKKNKVGGLTLSTIKVHYKTVLIKAI